MSAPYRTGLVWFRRDLRAEDHAALHHALQQCQQVHCVFVFDSTILDPRATWAEKDEYDRTATKLVQLFVDNFEPFAAHVDQGVRDAAPEAA